MKEGWKDKDGISWYSKGYVESREIIAIAETKKAMAEKVLKELDELQYKEHSEVSKRLVESYNQATKELKEKNE